MEDLVISLLEQRLGRSNEKNYILYKEENSIQMLYFTIISHPFFLSIFSLPPPSLQLSVPSIFFVFIAPGIESRP